MHGASELYSSGSVVAPACVNPQYVGGRAAAGSAAGCRTARFPPFELLTGAISNTGSIRSVIVCWGGSAALPRPLQLSAAAAARCPQESTAGSSRSCSAAPSCEYCHPVERGTVIQPVAFKHVHDIPKQLWAGFSAVLHFWRRTRRGAHNMRLSLRLSWAFVGLGC